MAKPTKQMQANARRAQRFIDEGSTAMTEAGRARMRQIIAGEDLSDRDIITMSAWFARHEVDKESTGWKAGEDNYPCNGLVAWLGWGGDAGKRFADRHKARIERDGAKHHTGGEAVTDIDRLDEIEPGFLRSPFRYAPHFLGSLRDDQVPRFYAALTDDDMDERVVPLEALFATQNRIDDAKVRAMMDTVDTWDGPLGTIVRHVPPYSDDEDGDLYIVDGHHRLAAALLSDGGGALVRYRDIRPLTNAVKEAGAKAFEFVVKDANEDQRLALGYAIVSTIKGEPYFDLHGDHIPDDVMATAATEFMLSSRPMLDMHDGQPKGVIVHSFPMTGEAMKALGIKGERTGWLIGVKVHDDATWEAVKAGERMGFSIGGYWNHEDAEDTNA